MFIRDVTEELLAMSKDYPVTTLLGPRQSGKTTLVRSCFADLPYANLEEIDTRQAALDDPRRFLSQYPSGVILDEIQQAPDLLSYIQVIVDETQKPGQFILTGSHQLSLHQAVSQSLAGRTALLELLPLSINELQQADIDLTLHEYMLRGFYPRIYRDNLNPFKAYRNYYQTYVERDVRQLINVRNLSQFDRFIRLCAGRIGQVINLSGIGNDIGVDNRTLKEWLSILEASFIVKRLQPYYENFGKRIIKSPKLYFTDVGLASYLLGIETTNQMDRDPLRGNLVENLVIMELIKARSNQGKDANLYYYRDNNGNEVDAIYKSASMLMPIEIKAAQTLSNNFYKGVNYFKNLVGEERCPQGYLIYAGDIEQQIKNIHVLNYKHAAKVFEE